MATQTAEPQSEPNQRTVREDRLEIPTDPARVFDTIAESDLICRACFRRLSRYERLDNEIGDKIQSDAFYVSYDLPQGARSWDILDREYYESVRERNRVDHLHSEDGRHTFCVNCGVVNTERSPDCRSKREAVDAAISLTTTLEELGIEHDWLLLVELVKQLKSKPETAGQDMECFREATRMAIEGPR